MSVIDNVRKQQAGKAMRSLPVPEWDCVVHCKPLTLGQRSRVFEKAKGGGLEYQAAAVCELALDAEGKRLFSPHDYHALCHQADPFVVEAVASFILGPDFADLVPDDEVDRVGEPSAPAGEPKISPAT